MQPITFFAEKSLRHLPELRISARYPLVEWIDDYHSFHMQNMTSEKSCVIFATKRGRWLKPFRCYHQNQEYQYFSLDLAEGCPFDCVYCYLQSYLNHGALVLFVNVEDLKIELQQYKQGNLWISTGLLTDSLISEKYFRVLPEICNLIPKGSVLELRSKSVDIQVLNVPEITRDNIVVSWSLSPEPIDSHYEYRTARLNERLDAARNAIALGYRIGFHFDPVFHFSNWKQSYENLFEAIQSFPLDRIAFLSLGLFRYMPELGTVIRKRFPHHSLLTGEFFVDIDGKYHYFREIRKEMYKAFSNWLTPWKERVPIFWSMEPDERLLEL
jgi:DNA repair photolyase